MEKVQLKQIAVYNSVGDKIGYWTGADKHNPDESIGKTPYNWGDEKAANGEIDVATRFSQGNGWLLTFQLEPYGE